MDNMRAELWEAKGYNAGVDALAEYLKKIFDDNTNIIIEQARQNIKKQKGIIKNGNS